MGFASILYFMNIYIFMQKCVIIQPTVWEIQVYGHIDISTPNSCISVHMRTIYGVCQHIIPYEHISLYAKVCDRSINCVGIQAHGHMDISTPHSCISVHNRAIDGVCQHIIPYEHTSFRTKACDHSINYVAITSTWTYGHFHTQQLHLSAHESNQWSLLALYTL